LSRVLAAVVTITSDRVAGYQPPRSGSRSVAACRCRGLRCCSCGRCFDRVRSRPGPRCVDGVSPHLPFGFRARRDRAAVAWLDGLSPWTNRGLRQGPLRVQARWSHLGSHQIRS